MDRNGPLFEKFALSLQCCGDHIVEKGLAAMAAAKNPAGDDALQFLPDVLLAGLAR